jgi:hypothetical protein
LICNPKKNTPATKRKKAKNNGAPLKLNSNKHDKNHILSIYNLDKNHIF